MIQAALLSSSSSDWETPQNLFNRLDRAFYFQTDVCATKENAKCQDYYDLEDNALKQEWHGVCWMNPPYGREIFKWVKKAFDSFKINNATVVCLLPARTDTKWWHYYCTKGEVYFIKGRLRFGESTENAPFPSAVVVFRPSVAEALDGY